MLNLESSFDRLMEKLQAWADAVVVNIPNLIIAVIVMIVFFFAARLMKKLVRRIMGRVSNNQAFINIISNLAVIVTGILGLFLILSLLHLDDALTALLGTAGVAGLAVGLALQGPLVNLSSGVIMSARPYYNVGDLVESNDFFGTISRVTMRSTVIRSRGGQDIVIPNKDVLQNPLTNYSTSGIRRVDIECGIAYGDDLNKVREVTINAIQPLLADENQDVDFFYTEFGSSSINFVTRFWLDTTEQRDYVAARHEAIMAIKKAFDENDITIPFPIRTLDFGVVGGERLDQLYPRNVIKGSVNENN